jgi:2-oxo-4-hydroxy-4-carboxy-5-ureidoimidazoline decarboxylase
MTLGALTDQLLYLWFPPAHPLGGQVDRLHSLSHEEAVAELMTCCAARSWAEQMSGLRPFPDEAGLVATGRKLAEQLSWVEVLEALSAHPRIGQRLASPSTEARWSRQEQSGVSADSQEALIAGNTAYENRFGHIFLICATGLSGEQVLTELTRRLENDGARERLVVRQELAKIVELRLRKLVTS